LLKHSPESISDPYVLSLICNALLSMDPKGEIAKPYLDRLEAIKRVSADGRQTWWELQPGESTAFYGAGECANIEATSLAALAFVKAGANYGTVRNALTWLADRRGSTGHWGSTQATILALKALMAGIRWPAGEGRRLIDVELDGQTIEKLDIPADQAEVM